MLHPRIEKLVSRVRFAARCNATVVPGAGPECLYVNSIYGVMRAVGELKNYYRSRGHHVFFRGQKKRHDTVTPKLLRQLRATDRETIKCTISNLRAQHHMMVEREKAPKRFQGQLGMAILQHYDIGTVWLDLTDNLFVAAYFAAEGQEHEYICVRGVREKCGFIYCLRANTQWELKGKRSEPEPQWDHCWCDLRRMLDPLSLRPHAQHGILLSRPVTALENGNTDLSDLVVGVIAFPIQCLDEVLNLAQFKRVLYPDTTHDNTYKWLNRHNISAYYSPGAR